MCGIIGIISNGNENISRKLLQSLSLLEYRGYDSAGIATVHNSEFQCYKTTERVDSLVEKSRKMTASHIGIGHTRWATHGTITENNCHPIMTKDIAIVHNGIIENYRELKKKLIELQYEFHTETDTEVIANLAQYYKDQNFSCHDVVLKITQELVGSFAFVMLQRQKDYKIIGVTKNAPLLFGQKDHCFYLSSDATALSPHVSEVFYIPNKTIVTIDTRNKKIANFYNFNSVKIEEKFTKIDDKNISNKGSYSEYMIKEIYEQPVQLQSMIDNHQKNGKFFKSNFFHFQKEKFNHIHIIACGSSLYVGFVSQNLLEHYWQVPVSCHIASEFCAKSKNIISPNDLYIFISQSGETADTIQCLKMIKEYSATTLAIINNKNSYIAKNADYLLALDVGIEIAVASTKSFTGQNLAILLLILEVNQSLQSSNFIDQLQKNVVAMAEILNNQQIIDTISKVAKSLVMTRYMIYIGKQEGYGLALEGALKMRELAYISSHGFAAGELKHGSLALIEENIPVIVVLLNNSSNYHKLVSNIREIKARKGKVITVTSCPNDEVIEISDQIIKIPNEESSFGQTLPYTVVLQLLAYYTAKFKGCDIDKPRNLAKSVTVD